MDITELNNLNFDINSRHPWERARLKIIIRFLKSIIRRIENPAPVIFDIGSGDAFVAFNVAKTFRGCEIHAVDTAFNADNKSEISKRTKNVKLFLYDDINSITLEPGKTADIVLLLDVIEHVEDDTKLLTDLVNFKHISKDTVFIITAPAFQGLYSSHDKFLKHYRRYSRKSLENVLKISGLQPLKSGYFFFVLLFPRIFRLWMEKLKRVNASEKGIGQWKAGSLISWFFYIVLMTDYFLCRFFSATGINIPGLSVYALCKPVR
ncbi:MAG: methyltransferase [Bacteroidales bacterium]|nr:methyltransferase [Bacteroidales bacterium]MBN2763421.1 methyltransferase [Bacteroidales bacterium]